MELFFSFLSGICVGIVVISIYFVKKIIEKNKKIAQLESENKYYNDFNVESIFLTEFENTANKVLKQNTEEFSRIGKKEIDELIRPFREKVIELTQKMEKARIDEAKELSSLETQVKLLAENNQRISREANNLATAIKGDSKTRGNWGEVILERILEASGLQKDIHYLSQQGFRDEDNHLLRPDVIIHLPNSRHLVIDSKVSLISYEKYCNTEENSEKYLKEYTGSVREHIKSLKNKFYQDIKDLNTPDFVLMFIPVESSFKLLLEADSEIFEFARKNRVLPVSPSTLLVTLKTIEIFWQQENQSRNVAEIAEESGKLYDKFVGMLSDIASLKNCFSKTLDCFENINKKLEGKGGLIRQTEKLKLLGARTSKEIPEACLELE